MKNLSQLVSFLSKTGQQIREQKLVKAGLELPESSKGLALAKEYQTKIEKGKSLNNKEILNLATEIGAEVGKNLDGNMTIDYNNTRGDINGSENSKILANRRISTVSGSRNSLWQQGENTTKIKVFLGRISGTQGKNSSNIRAGDSGWLTQQNSETSNLTGLEERIRGKIQQGSLSGSDTVGRVLNDSVKQKLNNTILKDENGILKENNGISEDTANTNEDIDISPEFEEKIGFTEPSSQEIYRPMSNEDEIKAIVTGRKTIKQRQVEAVSNTFGLEIIWDKNVSRGTYDPDRKAIRLNPNTTVTGAYVEIFKHEFTHYLQRFEGYGKFKDYLFNKNDTFDRYVRGKIENATGEKFTGSRADALKTYTEIYLKERQNNKEIPQRIRYNYNEEKIHREIVADFIGEYLLLENGNQSWQKTEEFLKNLKKTDKGIFARLIEWIREKIALLRVEPQNRSLVADLQKIEKKLIEVYNTEEKITDIDGDEMWSTALSNKITGINEQSEVEKIRSIGRKCVNEFTEEDIVKTERFARKYFAEMGVKSPFFRKWFGDWRAYDTSKIKKIDTVSELRGNVRNVDTNFNIIISRKISKETTHQSSNSVKNAIKYLPYIKDITENAILLNSEISNNKNNLSVMYHTFYSYTEIFGYPAILKLRVEELANEKTDDLIRRDYLLQSIEEESLSMHNRLSTPNRNKSNSSVNSISDLVEIVKKYDENYKPKTVDKVLLNENGTPKVFYHGTNETFTEFKSEEMSSREGSYFFAENKEDAKAYGKNVIKVYLTGENFADYDNQPSEFYKLKNKKEQVEWLKKRGYDGWYADADKLNFPLTRHSERSEESFHSILVRPLGYAQGDFVGSG